jgi:hypothetical protein
MIRAGLPAFVVLDSDPDQRYAGTVQKVAPLPDTQARWGNPNLKVYITEVYLAETPPNMKPGVSTKAEIIITNIADVLSVPIQTVTTYKGKQVVYQVKGGKSEPTEVEVGMFNTRSIQITQGLKEGDRVLVSPPFDSQEKDLEGAVLAADEKAKIKITNAPAVEAVSPNGVADQAQAEGAPGLATAESGVSEGGQARGPGGREGAGRRGDFNPEEMLKKYDKNGDGELDETERAAMRETSGGSRTNRTQRRNPGQGGAARAPRDDARPPQP